MSERKSSYVEQSGAEAAAGVRTGEVPLVQFDDNGKVLMRLPPKGWEIIQPWGWGYALRQKDGGLRVIIDCEAKGDGKPWIHISVSRKDWTPSHDDMCRVKRDFLGDRYAHAVYPPEQSYVNIHKHCLHLWCLAEGDGRVLPEFSAELEGIGRSI